MKKLLRVVAILLIIVWLYYIWMALLWLAINHGRTNSKSAVVILDTCNTIYIPSSNWIVYKYIKENPEDTEAIVQTYVCLNWTGSNNNKRFPKNNVWVDFILGGINTRGYYDEVKKWSKKLGVDADLVMASVLSEQLRIANKWARWSLKEIITWMSPRLLRAYNVSLWVGWIKVTTAQQTKKDADKYGYGKRLSYGEITSSGLADNDILNAKYSVFIVKNILTRWALSWIDLSKNPWIISTIYNLGNDKDRKPNKNPKIWWSIITIWWKDYVFGGIWLATYWYLKIFR